MNLNSLNIYQDFTVAISRYSEKLFACAYHV